MNVELVHATTSDSVRLNGAMLRAEPDVVHAGFDAAIFLHGAGSHFYGEMPAALGPHLQQRGISVLLANTRGHDTINTLAKGLGAMRLGTALELVDECRLDVEAWMGWLAERQLRRIVLMGHSLGALKAVYSQAYQPNRNVKSIVSISPPRLSYSRFVESPHGELLLETMQTAQDHIDRGDGDSLMEVSFPLPMVISASTYVDKYGPNERYNLLRFAHRVKCPVLFTYGELELRKGVPFAGMPEAIRALPLAKFRREVVVVQGANHMYSSRRDELAIEVAAWLDAADATNSPASESTDQGR